MSRLLDNMIELDDVPKSEWKKFFANGYRSVFYTTDAYKKGRIILFGFDHNGDRQTFSLPWRSRLKYNVKYQTQEQDIYGNYVFTKTFDNSYDRKRYLENANGLKIVECLKPEQEFLHEMFDKHVLDDGFNTQKMRTFYLDIETEISESFMPPELAENRINMLTLYDTETEKFYTWSLDHADIKFTDEPLKDMPADKFVFFEFHNNEARMLEHFLDWYENNTPDIVNGWNVKAYDMPYIVRRIENVLGKYAAQRLSPVNRYFIKTINHDNARADAAASIEVDISGLFIADGLVFYRDKFKMTGGTLDGGFGLSNVGENENLGRKIEYDGTLKGLYLNDYQKFYEYNVRDVDLCKRIDEKCNLTNLARQIISYGLTNYPAIYSSISYLIGSVITFAKTQLGGRVFNSYIAEKRMFSGFEGAFVYPTFPIVIHNGVAVIDFASLYPSIIRALNISPETFVGKVLIYRHGIDGQIICDRMSEKRYNIWENGEEDEHELKANDPSIIKLELEAPDGKRKAITLEQLKKLTETKCIYTPNNTLFLKHEIKTGIIPKWCEYFYGLRKATKKKMMGYFHTLHDPEKVAAMTPEEKRANEAMEEVLNCMQMAFKIMINSIYGILGTGFSPIANPHIAQTVTRMGKFCNRGTEFYMTDLYDELFGVGMHEHDILGMDTDSIFINLAPVTKMIRDEHQLPQRLSDWSNDQKRLLWDYMSKLVDERINPFVRNKAHDFCKTSQQNILTYELEYMGDSAIYECPKHYAVHKIFEEGDLVDKIKVSGIELKKSTVSKEMKNFLWDVYRGVLTEYWTEQDYVTYIDNLYDRFTQYDWDDVSFWKGYNSERQAVGFLQMQTGVTGVARASIQYNQIIERLKLGKKYNTIAVGNKVRLCYIKPTNIYGIDVIAYPPEGFPKEFRSIFEIDHKKMFEKIMLDPLKNFRVACGFNDHDPSKKVAFDIFSL